MGKILVTGASGFTGKALATRLIAEGHEVIAFVRPSSEIAELIAVGIECRVLNIKDPKAVRDNFTGIDRVYHIAAAYRMEHADHDEFQQVNVEATRHLLNASVENNVKRFVHCSTVGVQGNIDDPPAGEDYRVRPGDHYQETKLQGERLALEYIRDGLPGTVFRPVGIHGPGDRRFLKLFRSINKGVFVMIGTGSPLYHLTYIDDLVDGILLCGQREEALGQLFTLGGDGYTTIRGLVDTIADVLGKPPPRWHVPFMPVHWASMLCEKVCQPFGITPPIYPRRVEFFQHDRAFTIDKAKRLLGYQPKVGLKEGLERTAAWYQQNGLL